MTEGRYLYRRGVGYLLEATPEWGLGLSLNHFDDHASLHIMPVFGSIFVRLPKQFWRPTPIGEFMASWGFSWRWGKHDLGRALHLNWGNRCKIIHMPWDYTFIRHDVLMADGSWKRVARGRFDEVGDEGCPWNWTDKLQETHDYIYTLRSGTVQHRKATIGVEEREWRQKWLRWCPWFAKVRRTIDVSFSDEVGERTGSWKGGCLGCGYDLLPGETPLECLRRMERERKFT